MVEKFALINGINICYEIHGEENPLPVLLVHGFGGKKESWIAQIGALSKNYRIITMDNRGAGKSDRPNEPYKLEMFCNDIKGLIEHLDIDNLFAIMGWSLGGMIVQHFILRFPYLAQNVVLLFTNYKGQGSQLFAESQHKQLDLLDKDPLEEFWQGALLGFYRSFRKEMEKDISKKFYNLWSVEDLIKHRTTNPTTHQDINNQASALEDHNTIDQLDSIHNRTLLIAGSHDRLCPESTMREMHQKLPNSTFKVINRAGHSAPLSRAPEVNQIIIEFLEKSRDK